MVLTSVLPSISKRTLQAIWFRVFSINPAKHLGDSSCVLVFQEILSTYYVSDCGSYKCVYSST